MHDHVMSADGNYRVRIERYVYPDGPESDFFVLYIEERKVERTEIFTFDNLAEPESVTWDERWWSIKTLYGYHSFDAAFEAAESCIEGLAL